MKRIAFLFLLVFSLPLLNAQKKYKPVSQQPVVIEQPTLTKQNLARLTKTEDSLCRLAEVWMYDTLSLENRKNACYEFIPKFLNALKTDNSFYYPFDSLTHVSKVYSPDSLFRIFTWQLHYPKGKFRYYGLIQMRSEKLRLYPLKDLRDTFSFHTQQILSPENWYGCIYYNIIRTTINRQTYYTLFGFEAPDFISRRKILEVMHFENGKPVFGAPLFHFKYDSTALKMRDTLNRFFMEYKWDGNPVLKYDNEMEAIVYSHLEPPNPKAKGAYFAYVPDGSYEGFKWLKDRWQWIERVFSFAINENDNPPIPAPLFGTPKRQPVLPTEIEKPIPSR